MAVSSVVRINVDNASRPNENPISFGIPITAAKRLMPVPYTVSGALFRNGSSPASIITVASAITATRPSTSIAPYPTVRAWLSLSSCLDEVPDATNE